jgi:hypothetical protein
VDLSKVEGTGAVGYINVRDVISAYYAGGGPNITDAARQKADELGVDLSKVEGTGAEGRITVRDVTSAAY